EMASPLAALGHEAAATKRELERADVFFRVREDNLDRYLVAFNLAGVARGMVVFRFVIAHRAGMFLYMSSGEIEITVGIQRQRTFDRAVGAGIVNLGALRGDFHSNLLS